jgi:hypothetical protein
MKDLLANRGRVPALSAAFVGLPTFPHWLDKFYWWLEAQGLTRPLK